MTSGIALKKLRRSWPAIALCTLLLLGLLQLAYGQTADEKCFEVASIRAATMPSQAELLADLQAGNLPRMGPRVEGLSASYYLMTLKDLISIAYDMKPYQISGPEFLNAQRFDIQARMPEGSRKEDAPIMLRDLLAERFGLQAKLSTEEKPVYALIVGKDGPKLKESPETSPPIDPESPLKPGEMKMQGPNGEIRMTTHPDGSFTENMGTKGTVTGKMDRATMAMHIEASTVTMSGLADMLTSVMQMTGAAGKPVVDRTELKGNYQIALDLSFADLIAMARAQGAVIPGNTGTEASDPAGGGTSLLKSVEALGLKLDSQKAPVKQLTILHIEKMPTEN